MTRKSLQTVKRMLLSMLVLSLVFLADMRMVNAAAPAQITGLSQTGAGTTSVDVTWTAVFGSDITYVVEYSEDQVNWQESRSTTPEDSIFGLTSGKPYFVRVKAVTDYFSSTAREDGPYSAVLEVATVPDATSQTAAQTDATQNSATVTWAVIPGATDYDVTYVKSGSEQLVGTAKTNTYKITGLSEDDSFIVYVYPKRISSAGFEAKSSTNYMSVSSVKTTPGKPKVAVYDRDPRSGSNKNTLEVAHSIYYNANGYEGQVLNAKGKKVKSAASTSPFSIYLKFNKVKTTETVYVRLRAYTLVNGVKKYGPWSDKVLSVGAPLPNASLDGSNVKISWAKIANARKYDIYMTDSYSNVQKWKFKKVKTVSAKNTSVILSKFGGKNFEKYHTYYYYVQAQTKVGKKTKKSDIFYYKSFYIRTVYK